MEREIAKVGASPKDGFDVRSSTGSKVDPSSAIFAIIRQPDPPYGDLTVIGTGFYICHYGLFATAKHVLKECLDKRGQPTIPLSIVHRFPLTQTVQVRPIIRAVLHDSSDVAVGMAAPMQHRTTRENLWSDSVVLSASEASIGDKIATYAYPNATTERIADDWHKAHLYPLFYEGTVVECYPHGRDRVMMPGPCFRTSMHMHGGASGGPVFDLRSGRVCGINSTAFPDSPDVSFVSMVSPLLQLDIEGVTFDASTPPQTVKLARLVELGIVPYE
ncbi:hypothetical protein OKW30_006733 [Paraburkholderia sp. Clong3]|uniref:S1 family peptidase n=1 Tax=unclassified Paraburkholderia TaxID=2615204 RepID=UPI0016230271|nr:serine protease [Paraburkholderia sp. CI2]MBB5464147.1 hypothetical protein [Paraburkholderia sp. CI2]